jgi:hypothetical protein
MYTYALFLCTVTIQVHGISEHRWSKLDWNCKSAKNKRNSRLLSFDTSRTPQKTTHPTVGGQFSLSFQNEDSRLNAMRYRDEGFDAGTSTFTLFPVAPTFGALQFLNPKTGDQQLKQSKRRQTSMPWVGFEPTIQVFERAKTVHAWDRTVTEMGWYRY